MGYKVCAKINCNKLIAVNERYCEKHKVEHDKYMKENNKFYARNRTDTKELQFYKSSYWNLIKQVVNNKYKGICLYSYYAYNQIIPADVVHHIIEIKEDWNKRLEIDNLIPVSKAAHNKIHGAYKDRVDKAKMQIHLKSLIKKYEEEFSK